MNLEEFKIFVDAAHGEQKYGEHPYSYHLTKVLDKVREFTSDPYTLQAAYGHDLFEDTSEGTEAGRKRFIFQHTPVLYDLIDRLTDRPGKNRKERHLHTYWRIRDEYRALLVKLCDRFVNHEETLSTKNVGLAQMYLREYWEFKFALFRDQQYEDLWAQLDAQTTRLKDLVDGVIK